MAVTIGTSVRAWREVSTTDYWSARCLLPTASALYALAAATGAGNYIMHKSDSLTNPTTFTAQDTSSLNRPSGTVSLPFAAWLHTDGMIHVVAFTATNTLAHFRFDTSTDQWTTNFGTISTAVSSEHSVRVVVRSDGDVLVFFISSADDVDVGWARYEGASWTVAVSGIFASSNSQASDIEDAFIDSSDFATVTYSAPNGVHAIRTVSGANALGTAVSLSTIAADETLFNPGMRITPYDDSGTDKAYMAYTDSDGSLSERLATLEAASAAGNYASETSIESTPANVGTRTPVSTAVIGGVPYCAWWDDVSSGTIKYKTKSGGSWGSVTDFATGITRLIEVVPIDNNQYLAVIYQSGSNVVMDWIVSPSPPVTSDAFPFPLLSNRNNVLIRR